MARLNRVRALATRVLADGEGEIGKRYAGPVIGEPDALRWGDPGWDCSSFVAGMYRSASGGGVQLTAYTDAIARETEPIAEAETVPGDIVLYRYVDSWQPGVVYPHTGLWAGPERTLDCRYGAGVGYHAHLATAREVRRVRP